MVEKWSRLRGGEVPEAKVGEVPGAKGGEVPGAKRLNGGSLNLIFSSLYAKTVFYWFFNSKRGFYKL